jgi:membrane associated rhomboid family serine protease
MQADSWDNNSSQQWSHDDEDADERMEKSFRIGECVSCGEEFELPQEVALPSTQKLSGRSRWTATSEIVSGLGKTEDEMSPALERRVRDFKFAQQKRKEKYGNNRPWGVLGLYEHLASIRMDLEWAEDAAWRRAHEEPYLSWQDFELKRTKGTNRPFFTYFLLVFCTIMLILSIGVNGWKVEPLSVNPMVGPSASTLLSLGAKQSLLIVNEGQWYRLFSPMVLHAGVIHYLLNMAALWFVGSAIEKSHGMLNAAIAFVFAGVGGTILSAVFLPQFISVGASGGIFGFIGMCISDIYVNWSLLFMKDAEDKDKNRFRNVVVVLWLVFDIVINCVIGLTPFVDNFTHLGGLVYGFLCGLSTIDRLQTEFFGVSTDTCTTVKNNLVRFGGFIVSVVLIMTTTVILVHSDGATSPCSSCRYISCVPFPPWSEGMFSGFGVSGRTFTLLTHSYSSDKFWYCDDCDQVSADVRKYNSTSPFFDTLDMTCPDGEMETIDISSDEIYETDAISAQLPAYCRTHCDNVFKAAN